MHGRRGHRPRRIRPPARTPHAIALQGRLGPVPDVGRARLEPEDQIRLPLTHRDAMGATCQHAVERLSADGLGRDAGRAAEGLGERAHVVIALRRSPSSSARCRRRRPVSTAGSPVRRQPSRRASRTALPSSRAGAESDDWRRLPRRRRLRGVLRHPSLHAPKHRGAVIAAHARTVGWAVARSSHNCVWPQDSHHW